MSEYPNEPGFKEGDTSKSSARIITVPANDLRAMSFLEITMAKHGLTADEVAYRLNKSVLAIRPRITELGKKGLIRKSGERRKNSSGISACVWVIA